MLHSKATPPYFCFSIIVILYVSTDAGWARWSSYFRRYRNGRHIWLDTRCTKTHVANIRSTMVNPDYNHKVKRNTGIKKFINILTNWKTDNDRLLYAIFGITYSTKSICKFIWLLSDRIHPEAGIHFEGNCCKYEKILTDEVAGYFHLVAAEKNFFRWKWVRDGRKIDYRDEVRPAKSRYIFAAWNLDSTSVIAFDIRGKRTSKV